LTVLEHVHFMAALKLSYSSVPFDRTAIDALLAQTGLTASSGVRAGRLSGGQRRRLCLTLALLPPSVLVVLDEPTAGVDVFTRDALWTVIGWCPCVCLGHCVRASTADEAKQSRTVLLCTHHLDEASHLADRVAVVARGRVIVECDIQRLAGADSDAQLRGELETVRFPITNQLLSRFRWNSD
jgi:ABC-type multidrug transport system ATPase subunit